MELSIVPVEQFMRNLPFTVALEQSKYIGSMRIGSGQLTGPILYFEMNDGNTLNDLNACEARVYGWRRTILIDPLKHMFNRTRILHSLTVSGDGGGRMESGPHEVSFTGACTRDVAMHCASD